MLVITIPGGESYDDRTNQFTYWDACTLHLEHSLISLSKWESKWNKAFLKKQAKTYEESVDYIRCMTVYPKQVDPEIYYHLSPETIRLVHEYIDKPMTACYFPKENSGGVNKDTTTSELIYYWMISLGIPFECEKWHLNRLLALIRVCNMKNEAASKNKSGKKSRLSKSELDRRRKLNDERLRRLNTTG